MSQGQNRLHDRIVHKPEVESRFVVKGNVHPFAKASNDHGRISPSFRMERITMMFKSTDEQQADLDNGRERLPHRLYVQCHARRRGDGHRACTVGRGTRRLG